jgi:hypothetical protein
MQHWQLVTVVYRQSKNETKAKNNSKNIVNLELETNTIAKYKSVYRVISFPIRSSRNSANGK